MDPSLFGPGSFMGKLMGLLKGTPQGPGNESANAQNPGLLGKIGGLLGNTPHVQQPSFGSMSAPLEGSPGATVPLPPTRPPGDLMGQAGATAQQPQQPLGLFNQQSPQAKANQIGGVNTIMKALNGPPLQAPPPLAPMPPQQGAGPMPLPPMNLGGM